jgi:tetratricopeptide (TPR) repeat protein
MSNTKDYSKEIHQIKNLLDVGETSQVLDAAKQLLSQDPNNPSLQSCCAGIFIDCGSAFKDAELVNLGINLIKDILNKDEVQSSSYRVVLNYNLSNGYAELASLQQNTGANEAANEAFQKQKQLLQTVLLEKENLPDELLPNAITNYANLLDHLGRTVEAVDHYYDCLEVAPNHATAMGNCGSALQRLLNISTAHNSKVLHEAWRLMKEANQHEADLVRLSGRHVLPYYKSSLENFEKYIESLLPGGCSALEKWITEFEKAHKWRPSLILNTLKNERLLLTVNPRPSNCPSEYKDDIFFEAMVTAIDDSGQRLFQALAHAFNHAKEDFATARYLYYQSKSEEASLIEASTITSYIDTLDYADFGLRSGFLKSSLRLAADLLDKCAGFLNLYLELGHPEDQVILNNVWYSNRNYKKGLHPKVESRLSSNHFLAALYDLNKDLYLGKYPTSFRNLRNEATHKRLVLSWYGALDESGSSHSLEDFQVTVRFLLRMAKAAIIYVAGVVMLEEQQREVERQTSESKNSIAPGLPFRIGFGLSDELDRQG